MKKFLVLFGIALSFIFCCVNFAYCEESYELLELTTEIGTLIAVDEKYDEGLAKCNEALKKYPDSAELYSWRATVLNRKGKNMEALADIDKAIALNPEDLSYHVTRGSCMFDLGNTSAALEECNYVISKDPNDSTAYALRAVIKMQKMDLSGASEDLDKVNKLLDEEIKNIK